MSRPAHVRCENCCYFEGKQCRRGPKVGPIRTFAERHWCGEFRAEWPEAKPQYVRDIESAMREARVIPRPGYGVEMPEGVFMLNDCDHSFIVDDKSGRRCGNCGKRMEEDKPST